jgi:hypothetical protein
MTGPTFQAPSLTTVPDNVHAAQRYIMGGAAMPTKDTAPDFQTMFGMDLTKIPGGLYAQRDLNKPLTTSANYPIDASGTAHPSVTVLEADGKTVRVIPGEPQKGVGKPEKAEKPDKPSDAEWRRSLVAIINGQPQLALPEHRALPRDTAITMLDDDRKAITDPGLSVNILNEKIALLEEKIAQAEKDLTVAIATEDTQKGKWFGGDVKSAQAGSAAARNRLERLRQQHGALSAQRDRYQTPPRRPATPEPAAPSSGAARDRAREQGILPPKG